MAGERVTARKRKAGGKVIVKKVTKKFARHQSDEFIRVPVRHRTPQPASATSHHAPDSRLSLAAQATQCLGGLLSPSARAP